MLFRSRPVSEKAHDLLLFLLDLGRMLQRILRREAFENSRNSSLPATAGPDQELAPATQRTVSFTEIKLPSSSQSTGPVFHPDLVIRKGSLILEISNSASDELLSRIGGILGAE